MSADTVGKVRQARNTSPSYGNSILELQLTFTPSDHHLQGMFKVNLRQISKWRIPRAPITCFHHPMRPWRADPQQRGARHCSR
jgi:hypothetical protein